MHAVDDVLVGAPRPDRRNMRVDQRRLAVVDVGDDRDIAQVLAECHCPITIDRPNVDEFGGPAASIDMKATD